MSNEIKDVRGIFEPVNNKHGFDYRMFDILEGRPKNFRWLPIWEAAEAFSEIPRFKTKSACLNNSSWHGQFEEFANENNIR